jgi:hypothetical protein
VKGTKRAVKERKDLERRRAFLFAGFGWELESSSNWHMSSSRNGGQMTKLQRGR